LPLVRSRRRSFRKHETCSWKRTNREAEHPRHHRWSPSGRRRRSRRWNSHRRLSHSRDTVGSVRSAFAHPPTPAGPWADRARTRAWIRTAGRCTGRGADEARTRAGIPAAGQWTRRRTWRIRRDVTPTRTQGPRRRRSAREVKRAQALRAVGLWLPERSLR